MDITGVLEQNRIMLWSIIKHTLLVGLIWFVTSKLARTAGRYFSKPRRGTKMMKLDETRRKFLKHLTRGAIYFLGIAAAIHSIPALRAISTSLFAGAGVAAVVIGFASQQAFSNIVSGVFITLFQPFRVGDRVQIGTTEGVVEDITLRHTAIRNWSNNYVIIPNSVVSNEVIVNRNIGDEKTCRWVEMGISYDSDIDLAMEIMADEASKHPHCIDNRSEEDKKNGSAQVPVRVISLGDSSVNLRAYVWAQDPGKAWRLGVDLNKSIKERFDREGVEIPFPYRTLVYKKDQPKKKSSKRK